MGILCVHAPVSLGKVIFFCRKASQSEKNDWLIISLYQKHKGNFSLASDIIREDVTQRDDAKGQLRSDGMT